VRRLLATLLFCSLSASACAARPASPDGPIVQLERRIERREFAPDAVLISRGGTLIYERYWNGWHPLRPHDLRSVTESVTSLLVGIALQRGELRDLDAPVPALLGRDVPDKQGLTPRHLLAMRTGLACDDRNPESPGHEERMYASENWVSFALALPVASRPDQTTRYCTAASILLGAILERATGQSVEAYAREHLFGPLGIESASWEPASRSGTETGGQLRLTARDLLRIGQLLLDRGKLGDREIVGADWIEESTQPRAALGDAKYGFLWWSQTFGSGDTKVPAIFARGTGGQYLFVLPSLDVVVVFLGSRYDARGSTAPIEMLNRYLLPAMRTN
jgi:CubicO group peptidase (beta-lactamase class C family)